MTRLPLIAALATVAAASVATAQTPAATKTPAPAPAKVVAKTQVHTVTRSTHTTTNAPKGRMVTAKLANGKTVTYDCGKPGNASKTACK